MLNLIYRPFHSSSAHRLTKCFMQLPLFQVFYALIDQTLHMLKPSSVEETISIVADLKREHTSWKYVEGTHWHSRFSHLVSYGAGMSL